MNKNNKHYQTKDTQIRSTAKYQNCMQQYSIIGCKAQSTAHTKLTYLSRP